MGESRNNYFDFLRGVAIIMVVGIHTFGYHGGFDSFKTQANTILRQVLNVAVPLFFAISGFFLSKKDLTSTKNRIQFWRWQIPKVYIPALFWGFPWLVLSLLGGANPYIQTALWLLCGLSVLYFITVTIQNYLLLPLVQRLRPKNNSHLLILISFLTSFASIVFVTWIRAYKGIYLPLIIYAGFFSLWILFFVLGISLSQAKRDYSVGWFCLIAFITLILQFYEAKYITSIGGAGFGIKPSSFLFSAILITILFSQNVENLYNKKNPILNIITKIGEISFSIYLTHFLVIFSLSRIPYNHLWLTDWILTLIIDIGFILTLKKLAPHKVYRLLGL